MTSETELPASIAEQAAHWWVIVNSADCSANDRRAFGHWVTQSPERMAAYFRTAMLTKAARSRSVRWPDTSAAALIDEVKSSVGQGLQVSHESWSRSSSASRPINLGVSRRGFVLATAMAVVAVISGVWLLPAKAQVFETAFGEQRSIMLEDGTRVTLNGESKIEVKLGKDRRIVALSAGEALFTVAHDPSRAFVVQLGNAELRDIGTEFNVDRRIDRTTVTVVEGRVAVTPTSPSSSPGRSATAPGTEILEASDQLVITPSAWQAPRHGVDSRVAVSWTENKLIFVHTPLRDVAEEFNRYNRRPIQIQGQRLQSQEITGTFRSDDPTSFLSFLSNVPGVSIHDSPDGAHVVVQN